MAVTTTMYVRALERFLNKEVDWGTDDIRVALCTSAYTPSATTHDFYADITNELATGSGYTATGAALGTKTETQSGSTFQFDAANTTWTTSTLTARYAIIYDYETAVAATAPLIAYVDFGTDQSSSSGTFQITWDSTGVIVGTAS